MNKLFQIVLFLLGLELQAQIPAIQQQKSILLLNGYAHLGNGEVIPRAAVGFRSGKIDMVLAAFDIRMDSTKYDTIINIEGKHIYPGFIAPNSRLGLVEIDAVRATKDYDDVGEYSPHVRSLTAYNTESRITSTIRTNGVLVAEISPKGGVISGKSSVFELDGWNWEDAVLKEDNGIHLNWPNIWKAFGQKADKAKKYEDAYKKKMRKMNYFFKQAQVYLEANYHIEKNVRFESMRELFNQKQKLFVHVNRVRELTDAIYFFDAYDFEIVIVGGSDSWLVADLLKDREIPIILRRVHSLPLNQDDAVDLPFKLPSILHKKGLLVALGNSGSMEAMGTRNLPFYAGTAAAYGLDKEEALSMITLNTAKILGVDQKIGSIEIGKDATLFISKGDALDMRTNEVILAFIQGKKIDLINPQIELYRKYSKKYNQEN